MLAVGKCGGSNCSSVVVTLKLCRCGNDQVLVVVVMVVENGN